MNIYVIITLIILLAGFIFILGYRFHNVNKKGTISFEKFATVTYAGKAGSTTRFYAIFKLDDGNLVYKEISTLDLIDSNIELKNIKDQEIDIIELRRTHVWIKGWDHLLGYKIAFQDIGECYLRECPVDSYKSYFRNI